jgi:predicted Fe-S protein YdhL (DUF1289 family)
MPIQSPCNNKCVLDEKTNICLGCFRTIDEIVRWIHMNNQEKKEVLQNTEKRKQTIKSRWKN